MIDRSLRIVHGTQGIDVRNFNQENVDPNNKSSVSVDKENNKKITNERPVGNDNSDELLNVSSPCMNQANVAAKNIKQKDVVPNAEHTDSAAEESGTNIQTIANKSSDEFLNSSSSCMDQANVAAENIKPKDVVPNFEHTDSAAEEKHLQQQLQPIRAARRISFDAVRNDQQNSSVKPTKQSIANNADVSPHSANNGGLVRRAKSVDSVQQSDGNINSADKWNTQVVADKEKSTEKNETVCLCIFFKVIKI